MAVAYTMVYGDNSGPLCTRVLTFTSASGDGNGETCTSSNHGLSYVLKATVTLDTGGLNTPNPKIAIAGGTVTWTVLDTNGFSGRIELEGRP